MYRRVPPCLINLSSAISERRGSGSPFIIEAETGLISSQCLPVQHAPITNTTGAIATPLLLCNYSKERGKGGEDRRGRKKCRYLEGIMFLKSRSQTLREILVFVNLRRHNLQSFSLLCLFRCKRSPGRWNHSSLISTERKWWKRLSCCLRMHTSVLSRLMLMALCAPCSISSTYTQWQVREVSMETQVEVTFFPLVSSRLLQSFNDFPPECFPVVVRWSIIWIKYDQTRISS